MSNGTDIPTKRPGNAPAAHDHIGPYRLLERLGTGGMGEVYLAEQTAPVRRRVALKLIKLGMDTKDVLARFEQERQALVLMNHPNVAAAYDAGATPEGRPYFVMEYVSGEPITTYCDRHRVPLAQRLELFIQVCHAIQHAHTKGIIHRDLKPSNVLVVPSEPGRSEPRAQATGALSPQASSPKPQATVKVIDFGVAKAVNQRLTERTLFTEHGRLIGTPEYMSPEQAENTIDIDTRTDIYSLGVLLYELLTGTLPFDPTSLRNAAYAEIQRIIREVDPPKPSTRLSSLVASAVPAEDVTTAPSPPQGEGQCEDKTLKRQGRLIAQAAAQVHRASSTGRSLADLARCRASDTKSLIKSVRGDLDWIVMKCLEKDRTHRYETANSLAMEIRRYLSHEPVLAGPPSVTYRARKFVRRNRTAVLSTGIIAGVLVTATAVSIAFARSESRQRRSAELAQQNEEKERKRADRQRDNAVLTADFMASILDGVNASVALGRDTTMLREMLDAVAKRVEDGELKDSPESELRLRWTIGDAYVEIAEAGALQRGEAILLPTLALADRSYGSESAQMATSRHCVAHCLQTMGRTREALEHAEAALAIRKRLFSGDHRAVAASLNQVACCLDNTGSHAEALSSYQAALAMRERLFLRDDSDVSSSLNNVAYCLLNLGRATEALPKYEAALSMNRRLHSGDHPAVATSLNNVAYCFQMLGRFDDASSNYEAALEMLKRLHKGDHPLVARGLNNIAICQQFRNRFAEALTMHESALEMFRRLYQGDHPDVAMSLNNIADCLESLAKPAEALSNYQAALEMKERIYKGDHPDLAKSLNNLAHLLYSLGRAGEALPRFETALEMQQRIYKADHPSVAVCLNNVASCLESLGRPKEALEKHEAALAMKQRLYQGDQATVASAFNNVGMCLKALGRLTEALPKLEAALEMNQRVFVGDHPNVAKCLNNVGLCLLSLGRLKEALARCEAAAEMARRCYAGDHSDVATSLNNVGLCLESLGRPEDALARYEAASAMFRRLLPPGHWNTLYSQIGMTRTLIALGRNAEAEPLLLDAADQCEKSAQSRRMFWPKVLDDAVNLYDAWHAAEPNKGHNLKAAEWRAKLEAWQATTQPAARPAEPATQPAGSQPASSTPAPD